MRSKTLIVWDFQFLYYKYKHGVDSGRMKQLSHNGMDTSMIYYTMKEIEKSCGNRQVDTAICFDSKSDKKVHSDTYKANRKEGRLVESDFDIINSIVKLAEDVGYAVYKKDGYEADDLVAAVARKGKEVYDRVEVYTVDKDMLQLVDEKISVEMYRPYKKGSAQTKSYIEVNMNNFENVTIDLFKTKVPYNMIMAYKSLVGDASDNIAGVKGFGPSKFARWLDDVTQYDYSRGIEKDYVAEMLRYSLAVSEYNEAIEALDLVAFRDVDVEMPFKDGVQGNEEAYLRFGFESFVRGVYNNI